MSDDSSNKTAAGAASALQTKLKFKAAQRALDLVRPGMTLGLGSGSTASLWIQQLGEKVRDHGLKITAVASSEDSERLGRSYGIPFVSVEQCGQIDLTVDGADEFAPGLALIKGGGGKLLREKIVASASRRLVIVADSSKVVQTLGKFPLSVEVIPMAVSLVSCALGELAALAILLVRFGGRIAVLPFMKPLALLGQASLEIFCVHVCAVWEVTRLAAMPPALALVAAGSSSYRYRLRAVYTAHLGKRKNDRKRAQKAEAT